MGDEAEAVRRRDEARRAFEAETDPFEAQHLLNLWRFTERDLERLLASGDAHA